MGKHLFSDKAPIRAEDPHLLLGVSRRVQRKEKISCFVSDCAVFRKINLNNKENK